jgi:hypothetical protein
VDQQVVANLLHQLPLAAHREEHLKEHRSQQLLRRNGRSPAIGVDRVEQFVQADQRFVDHPLNRPQRVPRRDEDVQPYQREQAPLHSIGSAHQHRPLRCLSPHGIRNPSSANQLLRRRISTAC